MRLKLAPVPNDLSAAALHTQTPLRLEKADFAELRLDNSVLMLRKLELESSIMPSGSNV